MHYLENLKKFSKNFLDSFVGFDLYLKLFQKKAILLVSPLAPMWKTYAEEVGKEDIQLILLGTSRSTTKKWIDGGGINEGISRKNFLNAVRSSKRKFGQAFPTEKANEVFDAFVDDRIGLYEFGECIGFSRDGCQREIDKHIFLEHSILPSMIVDSERSAKKHLSRVGGLYKVFIERGGTIIQGRMRVRYIMEVADSRYLVRAKMNLSKYIPLKGDRYHYHEYDGFVSVRSSNNFFVFQERASLNQDYFHIVTDRSDLSDRNSRVSFGKYLSAEKGHPPRAVAGRVCLVKVGEPGSGGENALEEFRVKFMHNPPKNFEGKFDQYIAKEYEVDVPR